MNVELSRQASQFLRKTDKLTASRIVEKLDGLAHDPVPHDAKPIIGQCGVFRVRVGDYRILYSIEQETIYVVKIGKRDTVYLREGEVKQQVVA